MANDLASVGESALLAFQRYVRADIEMSRDKLEKAVSVGDITRAYVVQGGIEELRHLVAAIDSELRARRKERT